MLQTPPATPPLVAEIDVGSADEREADLYGRFSPRAKTSSLWLPASPIVPATSEGEAIAMVMALVLQIMPELQELYGKPVSPLSLEWLKVVLFEISTVTMLLTAPRLESTRSSPSRRVVVWMMFPFTRLSPPGRWFLWVMRLL